MAARAKRAEAITGNTISVDEDPGQLDEAAVVEAAAEVLSTALDDDLGEPDEGEQADARDLVDEDGQAGDVAEEDDEPTDEAPDALGAFEP